MYLLNRIGRPIERASSKRTRFRESLQGITAVLNISAFSGLICDFTIDVFPSVLRVIHGTSKLRPIPRNLTSIREVGARGGIDGRTVRVAAARVPVHPRGVGGVRSIPGSKFTYTK